MELPNTLNYRLIARHPHISCNLIDCTKFHGVDRSGGSLHWDWVQHTSCSLWHSWGNCQHSSLSFITWLSTAGKLEKRYQPFHCALIPLLLDPNVPMILAEIELKYHVEICVANSCGTVTVVSVKQFIYSCSTWNVLINCYWLLTWGTSVCLMYILLLALGTTGSQGWRR